MYAPQLEPVGKQLFVKRIERDDDFIEQMEIDLMEFKAQVDRHVETLKRKVA